MARNWNENPAEYQRRIATGWAEKHPELYERLEKALALIGGVTTASENQFLVEGERETYRVWVDPRAKKSACNCPDHLYRQVRCKHVLAVALSILTAQNCK